MHQHRSTTRRQPPGAGTATGFSGTLPPITDRLTAALQQRAPSVAPRLTAALDLACEQLEILCPAVMAATSQGFLGTLAAHMNQGAWLMVLANERKVFTMHLLEPPPPFTRLQLIEDGIASLTEEGVTATGPDLGVIIDTVVDTHGGPPGKRTPELSPALCLQILALLWMPVPKKHRADILTAVEKTAEAGICPLHVGLVGSGTQAETLCAAWPIGLDFAPYIEALPE
jgi:hypothetical protein